MNDLTPAPPFKPKRLQPKQKLTIENWLNRDSETFGNLYKSAVKAGFRPSYALNIASNKPLWLWETMETTLKLEQEHIIQGVQNIATNPYVDSRSPADTNLKALELLGNWSGLSPQSKGVTNNILVQPILNGLSVKQPITDQPPTKEQD